MSTQSLLSLSWFYFSFKHRATELSLLSSLPQVSADARLPWEPGGPQLQGQCWPRTAQAQTCSSFRLCLPPAPQQTAHVHCTRLCTCRCNFPENSAALQWKDHFQSFKSRCLELIKSIIWLQREKNTLKNIKTKIIFFPQLKRYKIHFIFTYPHPLYNAFWMLGMKSY